MTVAVVVVNASADRWGSHCGLLPSEYPVWVQSNSRPDFFSYHSILLLGLTAVMLVFSPLFLARRVMAQSVTLTSPVTMSVPEGADFASVEIGNAWDMNDSREFGWEQGYGVGDFSTANSVWTGRSRDDDAYVFPLYPGMPGLFPTEAPHGAGGLPAFGTRHPIDASKYTLLAFRMRHSNPSNVGVYWNNTPGGDGWSGTMGVIQIMRTAPAQSKSGWQVYLVDLRALGPDIVRIAGAWSGLVQSLRLDPSESARAGSVTEFDWIRLVDPNSAPGIALRWSLAGVAPTDWVSVYVSAAGQAEPLDLLVRRRAGDMPTGVELPGAFLPGGSYRFQVLIDRDTPRGLVTVARSGLSGAVGVRGAPSIHFAAPTEMSGKEYASTEMGNPWDMSDAADVANLDTRSWPEALREFVNPSFLPGGFFSAIAIGPSGRRTEGDAQVHVRILPERPIDPKQYRYLLYRMSLQEFPGETLEQKVARGWIAYPVFWGSQWFNRHGRTRPHLVYEGMQTYSLDLHNRSAHEYGTAWLEFPNIYNLRIDPLEPTVARIFNIDWVGLYAENTCDALGGFDVAWNIDSTSASRVQVTVMRSLNGRIENAVQEAVLSNIPIGNGSYRWQDPGSPVGTRHWFHLVVDDGATRRVRTSPVEVLCRAPVKSTRIARAKFDFDGDKVSDLSVLENTKGVWLLSRPRSRVRLSSSAMNVRAANSGVVSSIVAGDQTARIVDMDADGDGRSDQVTISIASNRSLKWRIRRSRDGVTTSIAHGRAGNIPVPGDYDGDGRDEPAFFSPSTGEWRAILSSTRRLWRIRFGSRGDIPVPVDFDRDGRTDLMVFSPSRRQWTVRMSGSFIGTGRNQSSIFTFGASGDKPYACDVDADGDVDLVTFRPSNRSWYALDTVSQQQKHIATSPLGLPVGCLDIDGDGRVDFTTVSPNAATNSMVWTSVKSSGGSQAISFGSTTARPPE